MERAVSLPVNVCLGEAGVLLASSEMLRRGVLPCRPCVDVGYDIVACAGRKFHRVQVKSTQAADSLTPSGSYRFNVCRRKAGSSRDGYYQAGGGKSYEEGDVDFFVFIHLPTNSLFVVPDSAIAHRKHRITLCQTSEFKDAWHLMGQHEQI
jgi:hypothetical protein